MVLRDNLMLGTCAVIRMKLGTKTVPEMLNNIKSPAQW